MKLSTRKPGTSTTFIDSASGEDILKVAADENGLVSLAYHIYDAKGTFVAESAGLEEFPEGLRIRSASGEVLLDVPAKAAANVHYRLYNQTGSLLTSSDGVRTKICPLLRMEGTGRSWVARRSADASVSVATGVALIGKESALSNDEGQR